MASGRVGGTKSKISGVVGSEVYSVRKNEDGSYSQVVSAKAENIRYSNTTLQAAQRMVAGMVEGLMKALKPIGTISMQSGANKSKSLNAFSQFNLMKVRDDMKANWYDSTNFLYPIKRPSSQDYIQTGGYWMISSGTLQYNLFSWFGYDDHYFTWMPTPVSDHYYFYGMKFEVKPNMATIRDFLDFHKITRRDMVCYVWWETDTIYVPGSDDPLESEGLYYIKAAVNPYLPDSAPVTSENLRNLFIVETNSECTVARCQWHTAIHNTPDGLQDFLAIGRVCENWENIMEVGWHTAFSISYPDGHKKVSSSSFVNVLDFDPTPYMKRPPSMAFGSWVGMPEVRPFPSPFG